VRLINRNNGNGGTAARGRRAEKPVGGKTKLRAGAWRRRQKRSEMFFHANRSSKRVHAGLIRGGDEPDRFLLVAGLRERIPRRDGLNATAAVVVIIFGQARLIVYVYIMCRTTSSASLYCVFSQTHTRDCGTCGETRGGALSTTSEMCEKHPSRKTSDLYPISNTTSKLQIRNRITPTIFLTRSGSSGYEGRVSPGPGDFFFLTRMTGKNVAFSTPKWAETRPSDSCRSNVRIDKRIF